MWTNAPLVVYHGTDEQAADNISRYGVNLAACRRIADFGRGFYVTSVLDAAQHWANEKLRRLRIPSARACVLRFDLNRDHIAELDDHLTFVLPSPEFFAFVTHNRSRKRNHARTGYDASGKPLSPYYDVVYGPVAGKPLKTVYVQWDQICLLNNKALSAIGGPNGKPLYGSPIF